MYTQAKVVVLLAAYNGGKYIREQLKSILEQDFSGHIKVIVRDDNSRDDTVTIVNSYLDLPSNRSITLIQNPDSEHGHLANFSALCQIGLTTESEYFAFADQDDVWHKNKISRMFALMQSELKGKDNLVPIMIHSDLRVVDEALNQLSPSYIKYQGLPDPDAQLFPTILRQNVVTGCTTFFNRVLLEKAFPVPQGLVVHDWWFALWARFYGKLIYIDDATIDYRQHNLNAIGAQEFMGGPDYTSYRFYKLLFEFPRLFQKSIKQAIVFKERASAFSSESELARAGISEYADFNNLTTKKRIAMIDKLYPVSISKKEKLYLMVVFTLMPWIKP
ncbi:glycosyltransferase family 2 protein [Motilimonas pumila]|uniref:glycosyltransferase family 2 protein n=1 Tax=Motilimonas pumila TaxID=2303987 RepID=UPI0013140B36|nr:glycosyltransferase family 2 protein [Motilimonas pumila]